MRKTSLAPASMHAGPNMTPLVDVVMVILIFLMLAGSFGIQERAIRGRADITDGIGKPVPGPVIDVPTRIDVHVHRTSAGADVMQVGGETVHTTDALAAKLRERHAQFAANGTADKVEIIIRPTAETAWAPVIATYDAAVRAEFKKVLFATSR